MLRKLTSTRSDIRADIRGPVMGCPGENRLIHRRLQQLVAASIACLTVLIMMPALTEAKTPGKTHCFNGICHYVRTISETKALVGKTTILTASFYDDCKKDSYNPCGLTSSGEYFRSWKADNAASPIYPDGTKLLVWHPKTKKTLVVRINNAGPYYGDRKLDLARAAADKLGVPAGVTNVHVRVLEAPSQKEATYSRGRTYPTVPGYVGIFADIDRAFSDIGRSIAGLFKPSTAQAAPVTKTAAATPAPKTAVAAKPTPKWEQKSALGATPAKTTTTVVAKKKS
jgi:rare lipoprotein A